VQRGRAAEHGGPARQHQHRQYRQRQRRTAVDLLAEDHDAPDDRQQRIGQRNPRLGGSEAPGVIGVLQQPGGQQPGHARGVQLPRRERRGHAAGEELLGHALGVGEASP
jgi:hypothetical protein